MDNCMGSGTYGAVAVDLGRPFIGIEEVEDIFETAKARIYKTYYLD
jgi:DNA modification methylase